MSELFQNQKTRSVLMSTKLFDNATVISVGGEDTGFPVENLQNFQPKRKWHHSEGPPVATHFVADLGADAGDRTYNAFAALFHNSKSDMTTNRWRIQTGNSVTGTGVYDSGFIPLWDFSPAPAELSFRSAEFYQANGAGSHSFHVLGTMQTTEEFPFYLNMDSGQVTMGDVLDPGGGVAILARVRVDIENPFFPLGIAVAQKGISNVLTGASSAGGGVSLGLVTHGSQISVVATVNDGAAPVVVDSHVSALYLQPGWNEIAMRWSSGTAIVVYVNGQNALTPAVTTVGIPNTTDPFRLGKNSAESQVLNNVDIERLVVSDNPLSQQQQSDWEALFNADLRNSILPSFVRAVYPIDTGFGNTIEDIGPSGFDGTLSGTVTWSTAAGGPGLLAQRYVRVDFEVDRPTLTMGRFVIARTLEPVTPYGTALPTPIGSPPKIQVTWPVRITRDQYEEIGYALTLDRGNAPEVLNTWGHDSHLIDGGKTVVSVNNINAANPWQRHQQTVYGYIASLDEIATRNTGLVDARLTVRGM